MPMINCYVEDDDFRWLQKASSELGRKIEELAEASIANAAIDYKVSHRDYRLERKATP